MASAEKTTLQILMANWLADSGAGCQASIRLGRPGVPGVANVTMIQTDWESLLRDILAKFGCQTGTIHRTVEGCGELRLVCQIGVPGELLDKIAAIPVGKGIAGAAAERRGPVTLCNLQQDLGGVARPEARKTGVSGSIAVPVFATDEATSVIGTLGIGKFVPHDFSAAEIRALESEARVIAGIFEHKGAGGG